MCEIRPADLNDLEDVYSLMIELQKVDIDKAQFERVYKLNLSNPEICYFLAVYGGDIVGFISVHIQELLHHTSAIAEVQELIVRNAYRGKGIGKKLFEQATEIARLKNCTQLEVCCNQNNTNSHGFYLNCGTKNSHFKFCMVITPAL